MPPPSPRIPNTVVTAVCDISQTALDRYVELWGPAATYTDFHQMLANEELDLVSIVTPDHLHAESFEAAADAGVKGIFCEKPIATTLEDADRMIAAAERTGVQTVVNHTRRFDPFYRQARWLIEQGTIGEIRSVLGTLSGERAMLFRNGTHLLDTIGYLLGDEPAWTMALLDDRDTGYGTVYKGDGGRDPATDPGATAIIGYRNGVRALYNGVKAGVAGLADRADRRQGRTCASAISLPSCWSKAQPAAWPRNRCRSTPRPRPGW